MVKEKQFKYQSEIWFIIDSSGKEIVDYLHNNTIEIGDLSGIAHYADEYFKDGIEVNLEIKKDVEDDSFSE